MHGEPCTKCCRDEIAHRRGVQAASAFKEKSKFHGPPADTVETRQRLGDLRAACDAAGVKALEIAAAADAVHSKVSDLVDRDDQARAGLLGIGTLNGTRVEFVDKEIRRELECAVCYGALGPLKNEQTSKFQCHGLRHFCMSCEQGLLSQYYPRCAVCRAPPSEVTFLE